MDDVDPFLHARENVVRADFHAVAAYVEFVAEIMQQRSVATAQIEHTGSRFDPGRDGGKVRSQCQDRSAGFRCCHIRIRAVNRFC